jgi:hypothetical protein
MGKEQQAVFLQLCSQTRCLKREVIQAESMFSCCFVGPEESVWGLQALLALAGMAQGNVDKNNMLGDGRELPSMPSAQGHEWTFNIAGTTSVIIRRSYHNAE